MHLFRTKNITPQTFENSGLHRVLRATDLVFLGVGAIIGAGIFILTGIVAATKAGPAVILSYLLAGIACAFTAFSYAELASSVGGSGSAYGYAYAGLGEFFAWLIGWALILEYAVSVSAVAIGWSAYVNNALGIIGIHIPTAFISDPSAGGIIDLPAVLVILALSVLLSLGVHNSARFNNAIVIIKFLVIGLFIAVATSHIHPQYWHPFTPFGWKGIAQGAALIFFAYIGFDAVSTAAEETVNPSRDLPIGIIGSLVICTVLYIIVSGILTGIAPYSTLNTASPVADALVRIGQHITAGIVSAGAIAGLTTVMLVMYYGLTRIFFAMSRDGLLPPVFAHVNQSTRAPVRVILASGVIIALISGFVPMGQVAEMVNIGTLAAFVVVCIGVIVLRITKPDLHRPYKTPLFPFTPILGMGLCFYLMLNLSSITWIRFCIWMAIGFVVYFAYSYRHSLLYKKSSV